MPERRTPTHQLIDQLWPTPEPPRDTADKVLKALAREQARAGAPVRQSRPAPAPAARQAPLASTLPAPSQAYRRAAIWAAASASVAAAVLVAAVWVTRLAPEVETPDSDGQLLASARQTVNIGTRGAAAVEPGADLTWSVRGKRVRVKQRRGSVFYRVEKGGPFRVSTPAGMVEVTGTCFRVTTAAGQALAASTLVSVLEGSVRVTGAERTLAIGAGQSARLQPGRAPELVAPAASDAEAQAAQAAQDAIAQERERAQRAEERLRELERQLAEQARTSAAGKRASLLLPLSPRLQVYGDRLETVSLTLPGRHENAKVEVARDSDFKQEVYSGRAGAGFVTVPAPARGDLYWRLAGASSPAGHARFAPESARTVLDLDSPRNVVSEGRELTTIYFQGAPPELTFSFAAADSADRYLVRVYRAKSLERPVYQKVVTEARASVRAGALGEGHYVWTALPLDTRGSEVGGGRLNKLELVYDNALSDLAISRPRPGEVVSGRGLEVQGVAPLGARLYVNGRPVSVDHKGRFSLRLGPTPRLLVFRLLGGNGSESYWVRRVASRS